MADILNSVYSLPEILFGIFLYAVLLAFFVGIFALCIFFMYVIFEKLQDLYYYVKRKFNEK